MAKDKKIKKPPKPSKHPEPSLDFDAEFAAIVGEQAADVAEGAKVVTWQLPTDLSGQPRPEDAIRFQVNMVFDVQAVRMLAASFEDATTSPNPEAVKFLKQYVSRSLQNIYPAAKQVTDLLGERARTAAAEYGWTAADGWPNDEAFKEFYASFDSTIHPDQDML